MVKFDKRGGVIGAVVGATTAVTMGMVNLPLIEKVAVACVVGFIAGIITSVVINFIWKKNR